MRKGNGRLGLMAGASLCVLTLLVCVLYQRAALPVYLDGDMAGELALGHWQAKTGSLVQMDWMYTTELRIISTNLLYALAFLLDVSCAAARMIGNTLGLALLMGACALLLRRAGLGWGAALAAASALALTAGPVYGYTMTVGGVYIFHCLFGYLAALLWLRACGDSSRRAAWAYALLCAAESFLSVRYVLCFICPALLLALLEALTARETSAALTGERRRTLVRTGFGFACCILGYAASEVIMPRLFSSGVGAANTFHFGVLSGQALSDRLLTILTDTLRLLGWQNEAKLFSLAGIVNLCILGVAVLGTMMMVRACRAPGQGEDAGRHLILLALCAVAVNLFSFLFIEGTYINRYLVPAVILLLPAAATAAVREKNRLLSGTFVLLLAAELLGAQGLLLARAKEDSARAEAWRAPLTQAGDFLMEAGYTHGYGSYWNVRLLEECSEYGLSFASVTMAENEEGALCAVSPELTRWMEPAGAARMDACEGKTFLLLSRQEQEQGAQWLSFTGAPLLYENEGYCIYGFESSQAFISAQLLGKAKLENARWEDGVLTLEPGGRLRVPTSWREAGTYEVKLTCEGKGCMLRPYMSSSFRMIEEFQVAEGENAFTFVLPQEDKYFMLLLKNEGTDVLHVREITLRRTDEGGEAR